MTGDAEQERASATATGVPSGTTGQRLERRYRRLLRLLPVALGRPFGQGWTLALVALTVVTIGLRVLCLYRYLGSWPGDQAFERLVLLAVLESVLLLGLAAVPALTGLRRLSRPAAAPAEAGGAA